MKALKKRGKGVHWVTRFQFNDDDLPFIGSDVDIKLKTVIVF